MHHRLVPVEAAPVQPARPLLGLPAASLQHTTVRDPASHVPGPSGLGGGVNKSVADVREGDERSNREVKPEQMLRSPW